MQNSCISYCKENWLFQRKPAHSSRQGLSVSVLQKASVYLLLLLKLTFFQRDNYSPTFTWLILHNICSVVDEKLSVSHFFPLMNLFVFYTVFPSPFLFPFSIVNSSLRVSFTTTFFPAAVDLLCIQTWKNIICFSRLNIPALTFRILLNASGKDPGSHHVTIVWDPNWSGQNVILMLYFLCYLCYKLYYILGQIVSPLFFCPYWCSTIMIVNSHQLPQSLIFFNLLELKQVRQYLCYYF